MPVTSTTTFDSTNTSSRNRLADALTRAKRKGRLRSKKLTSAKAKEILRDGTAQGQALTAKQKRYFGWVAGGSK